MFHGADNSGHVVSGTADFSASGDTLTLALTNTTPLTRNVTDLLSGIDFSLDGLTPTLTSVTGILRDVAVDGSFSDGSASQNLSWSFTSIGGDTWQLDSHPDAKNAIIGPASQGDYGDANRSVRGNPGDNPYAAQTVIATFNVPGLSSITVPIISVTRFAFSGGSAANGTLVPSGSLEIPEPTAATLICMVAIACMWFRQRQSRGSHRGMARHRCDRRNNGVSEYPSRHYRPT